ncbi:MAG TPA: VOC family protein [Actinomycetota bacterium]|nr:VOC family protein [Actinomycetota bacterium]
MGLDRLDHSVIAVSDWERSNAFYRDVVGVEALQQPDGRWLYRIGDQQLSVHGPGVPDSPLRPRVDVQAGGAHVCFTWAGPIEDATAHLESHGVSVEEGPVEREGGRGQGSSVYFRDPDGNLLEFISYG